MAVTKKTSKVALLEQSVTENPSNLNPLVDLLALLNTSLDKKKLETCHSAFYSLHRIFTAFIKQGKLDGKPKKQSTESVRQVHTWLKGRYADYVTLLCTTLSYDDANLRSTALKILLDLVKIQTEVLSTLSSSYKFADSTWRKLVFAMLSCQNLAPDLKDESLTNQINHYDDLRYFFLKEAALKCAHLANLSTKHTIAENLLYFLEGLYSMPTQPEDLNRFYTTSSEALLEYVQSAQPSTKSKKRKRSVKDVEAVEDGSTGIFDSSSSSESDEDLSEKLNKAKLPALLSMKSHQRVFQNCWLALLPLLETEESIKRVLVILHRRVLPNMVNPGTLLDFLSDCSGHGGTVALLALNGLFSLMSKHNLDYPSFYHQLYALLDRQVMHVKYRPRFFRMLETFLSSSHLPVILVASFIKRLSRLSLAAPPAAIVTIIPFVYNMLKLHPQCIQMISKEPSLNADGSAISEADPFKAKEADPLKTMAIDSSLWELTSFSSHYLASVSTLAKIFTQQLSKPNYQLEDFLDHTYSLLFETEIKRKILKAPALDLPPPEAKKAQFFVTLPSNDENTMWSDAITDLWTF